MMKQKVSLVLSGGGARGIAHIGVIEELETQGFEIASIAGTSMGAMVGGVYAIGKMNEFKTWMCSLDKIKVFSLVDFSFSNQGLVKGDKVFNAMKEFIGDKNIEDLIIPFAAVAADLLNKKEVVFTSGSVWDAIRASVAIPTVITPVVSGNALLVDGGVLNNIPVNRVKRTNDDILIAVNVSADIPPINVKAGQDVHSTTETLYKKNIKKFQHQLHRIIPHEKEEKLGFFDLMNKTIELMRHHITQMSLEKHAPDLMINISRESCGTYDFYRSAELIEIGREAARNSLQETKIQDDPPK
ncbi:MAG: patatin-like phospholipase family protein [Bacteroidales bacterium]|nr:patatin-like phospholipase family protein [Bacteroidales bacterium]